MAVIRMLRPCLLLAAVVALAGCTAAPVATSSPSVPGSEATAATPTPRPTDLAQRDIDALTVLAEVAPRTSTIDPELADWTECWLPSDHLIAADQVGNSTSWKVLCRIHWHEADGTARYQDTTCIGNFVEQPMLDHCYRWVHYDFEPRFEDYPGVTAGVFES
ncbi:MAG: hypothetical protein QM675_00645 [Protaetiibacter sp.]